MKTLRTATLTLTLSLHTFSTVQGQGDCFSNTSTVIMELLSAEDTSVENRYVLWPNTTFDIGFLVVRVRLYTPSALSLSLLSRLFYCLLSRVNITLQFYSESGTIQIVRRGIVYQYRYS
jgi:hypothetical protein